MGDHHATRISNEAPTVEMPAVAPPRPDKVHIEVGALSHVGKVRQNNEDHFLVARLRKALTVLRSNLPGATTEQFADKDVIMVVVADGMGGHAGGEHASALAIGRAVYFVLNEIKWFYHLDDPDEEMFMRQMRAGLGWLEREVVAAAKADTSLAGMGTTLTGAALFGLDVHLIHAGDSRAYVFHGGRLEQLTRDHTLAQQLLEEGLLQPQEIHATGLRHVLTNVIGGPAPGVVGEIHKLRLSDGDRLLLCTDGLTEMVPDEQMAGILAVHVRPDDACQALVDAALAAGGRDNVSVIVADFTVGA
jgi:protein phosphatase